jgi:hypothetical protein
VNIGCFGGLFFFGLESKGFFNSSVGVLGRIRFVGFMDLFHYLFLRSAVGGNGWSQYENGLDRPLLGIFAGEEKADKRDVFENRDAADHGVFFVLPDSADYEAFTLPNAVLLVLDFLSCNNRYLLYTFRCIF